MEILELVLIVLVIVLIVLIIMVFIGYYLDEDFTVPVGFSIIILLLPTIAVVFYNLQQTKIKNNLQWKTQCVQCDFEIENTDTLYCPNCGNKWMGEEKCTCENCIAVETTVCDCDKCKGLK